MAKYVRRGDDGEQRILSEEERTAEDESASQSTVAAWTAAVCTLTFVLTIGLDTPMTRAGAIVVGFVSLALGAALYRYILALIGLIFAAGLCLAVLAWVFGESRSPDVPEHVTVGETGMPAQVAATVATPAASVSNSPVQVTVRDDSGDPIPPPIPAPDSNSSVLADRFIYPAQLVDRRGKIVLQSEPRMSSRNVATLLAGSRVFASSNEGKWIEIQTQDGQVGFVRLRQLGIHETVSD